MLKKSIAIALFAFGVQNAFAGNQQAQHMIQGGNSVAGVSLPASSAYNVASSNDQGRSLLAPTFVRGAYVGTSTIVAADGHEQARRLLVAQ